jgi:hypothetical protein
LDFVSFTIGGPPTVGATAGTCTDSFMVGGSTTVAPIICGVNTGQHSKFKEAFTFISYSIAKFYGLK